MKPGHGEVLLTEGDPRVRDDEERLVEEFRRQLDDGMWAAVPVTAAPDGRRGARVGSGYADIPAGADRGIFFSGAAGGWGARPGFPAPFPPGRGPRGFR